MGGLKLKGSTWHLRMRVPKRYAAVVPKGEITRSLRTGDKKKAAELRPVVERQILAELDARLAGLATSPMPTFEVASTVAEMRSFPYRTAKELAAGSIGDILARVEDLVARRDAPKSVEAAALLGGVDRPQLTITEVAKKMPEWFPLELHAKTERQKRNWRARWTRPAGKVVEFLGKDPVFVELTRADAKAVKDALQDRVLEGDLQGSSAQKEIQNLDRLWKRFHKTLDVFPESVPVSPFHGLSEGLTYLDEESRKKEVPIDLIGETLLAPGAMDFMNEELRDIIFVLIETGARQSEITDLPPGAIFLDAPIPFIRIAQEKGDYAREIKNASSKRDIPLVGVALEAMKRHPEGFPRYRGKGTFSAAANKSLREHGLLPDDITIGGLRHSFETRLHRLGLHNDDRAALMGHSVKKARGRPVYGDDMPLSARKLHHEAIAFRLPHAAHALSLEHDRARIAGP